MAKRITVVVSQGQSASPGKRDMEENIVTAMLMEPGVDAMVIPHLYDLQPDGTGILALQGINGPMIVLSWLFERAARWTLDRNGIRGHIGTTLIKPPDDEEDDDEVGPEDEGDDKLRVIDSRPVPNRRIYCLDLRVHNSTQPYLDEIRRIRDENRADIVELTSWLGGTPNPNSLGRYLKPTNDTALQPSSVAIERSPSVSTASNLFPIIPATPAQSIEVHTTPTSVLRIAEEPDRRWYPVIDYSRCTNCMECIDFCLFGVYGVDRVETILVEQPDNCRKGCPACSRVCPENAIIFPQHKTPAIAGADVLEAGSLKIDLSKLFGAPDVHADPLVVAAQERDEQLMLAGRGAVGMEVGMPKRQAERRSLPKDDLDDLIDALDEFNL